MLEANSRYNEALQEFFRTSKDDGRLTPVHISLYFALFCIWVRNDGRNPIVVTRQKLMKYAKIKSTATYTKCIYDLQKFSYLSYRPSYHPEYGSSVTLHSEGIELRV
jgi:ubiquinone/menaquinone biosynthesis C-methylase UbiE